MITVNNNGNSVKSLDYAVEILTSLFIKGLADLKQNSFIVIGLPDKYEYQRMVEHARKEAELEIIYKRMVDARTELYSSMEEPEYDILTPEEEAERILLEELGIETETENWREKECYDHFDDDLPF